MIWVVGLLVFALVHFLGVVAGVLLVNQERGKAIAVGVVAMLIAALSIHFVLVAAELRTAVERTEADELR